MLWWCTWQGCTVYTLYIIWFHATAFTASRFPVWPVYPVTWAFKKFIFNQLASMATPNWLPFSQIQQVPFCENIYKLVGVVLLWVVCMRILALLLRGCSWSAVNPIFYLCYSECKISHSKKLYIQRAERCKTWLYYSITVWNCHDWIICIHALDVANKILMRFIYFFPHHPGHYFCLVCLRNR